MAVRAGIPSLVTAHSTDDGVISANPCVLTGAVVSKVAAGQTLTLYDCAAVGDVATGNRKAILELDTRESYTFGTDGAFFRVGLVGVLSGGATAVTLVWA